MYIISLCTIICTTITYSTYRYEYYSYDETDLDNLHVPRGCEDIQNTGMMTEQANPVFHKLINQRKSTLEWHQTDCAWSKRSASSGHTCICTTAGLTDTKSFSTKHPLSQNYCQVPIFTASVHVHYVDTVKVKFLKVVHRA